MILQRSPQKIDIYLHAASLPLTAAPLDREGGVLLFGLPNFWSKKICVNLRKTLVQQSHGIHHLLLCEFRAVVELLTKR